MDFSTKGTPANGQGLAALAVLHALLQALQEFEVLSAPQIVAVLDAANTALEPAIGMAAHDAVALVARLRPVANEAPKAG
jgi:hypothetical protein